MKQNQIKKELDIEFVNEDDENFIEVDESEFRDLYVYGEIDEGVLSHVKSIINYNREDDINDVPVEERTPIKIYIYSDGGKVDPTMILVDVIQMSKTPVYTIIQKANSSGFLLSQAGHKRFATPFAKALLHCGEVGLSERLCELKNQMNNILKHEKGIKDFILKKSKVSEKEYDKRYKEEWMFNVEDLIQYGFIDEVLTDISEIF